MRTARLLWLVVRLERPRKLEQRVESTYVAKGEEKVMAKETNIYITQPDNERLTRLIEIARDRESDANDEYLKRLEEELDRAEVIAQKDIPADVITMRSVVRLKDLDTREETIYSLVFPTEANYDEGKISVLAPIGTAMLGYRRGDVIEWRVPSGFRKLSVEEVLYQPKSNGDYHL
jgi:regulator of nucleoside diphosphate kinase